MTSVVLAIAGSDSGGGAGIQADIKTITMMGGFATTAITAITAQNTCGVHAIAPVMPEIVSAQIKAVLDDFDVAAVKIGMLSDVETMRAVAEALEQGKPMQCVVDPVMVATSGSRLMQENATAFFMERILPRATVLTPNLPEAEIMTGRTIVTLEDMIEAAHLLRKQGAEAVLVKGGHLRSQILTDILVSARGIHRFSAERIETAATHGTGCTLSSAIATCAAQGDELIDAVDRARTYVREAMMSAPSLGRGKAGPMNHGLGRGGQTR